MCRTLSNAVIFFSLLFKTFARAIFFFFCKFRRQQSRATALRTWPFGFHIRTSWLSYKSALLQSTAPENPTS